MSVSSQSEMILEWMLAGNSISPLEALGMYGCMRLGARIYDLRSRGFNIKTEMVDNGSSRYARYYIPEEEREKIIRRTVR